MNTGKTGKKRWFQLALAVFMLATTLASFDVGLNVQPAEAASTRYCASIDYQEGRCNVGATIATLTAHQVSTASCNGNYWKDGSEIVVVNGCRANFEYTTTGTTGSSNSANVDSVLNVIDTYDMLDGSYTDTERSNNRGRLRDPLKRLTIAESTELMDIIRADYKVRPFVESMVNVDSSADFHQVATGWVRLIRFHDADYLVEALTYTKFHQISSGNPHYVSGGVYLTDYNQRDVLVHETNHSFNSKHGLGGLNALNEGLSITISKAPADRNMAEATFGTVLYYRDIGIPGYPTNLDMGSPNGADAKGEDVIRYIMIDDASKINWLASSEINDIYTRFWEPLNRNQSWNDWLADANQATQDGRAYLGR